VDFAVLAGFAPGFVVVLTEAFRTTVFPLACVLFALGFVSGAALAVAHTTQASTTPLVTRNNPEIFFIVKKSLRGS